MSSWNDSSDFASLAAALSQAKKLQKSIDTKSAVKPDEPEIVQVIQVGQETKPDSEAHSSSKYSDFPEGQFTLPVAESFTLKQHKSTVSALEFEMSGSRFLSGSHDTTVAYWDFNGMVKDQPEPFRFIEPMGSHTVSIQYKLNVYFNRL